MHAICVMSSHSEPRGYVYPDLQKTRRQLSQCKITRRIQKSHFWNVVMTNLDTFYWSNVENGSFFDKIDAKIRKFRFETYFFVIYVKKHTRNSFHAAVTHIWKISSSNFAGSKNRYFQHVNLVHIGVVINPLELRMVQISAKSVDLVATTPLFCVKW